MHRGCRASLIQIGAIQAAKLRATRVGTVHIVMCENGHTAQAEAQIKQMPAVLAAGCHGIRPSIDQNDVEMFSKLPTHRKKSSIMNINIQRLCYLSLEVSFLEVDRVSSGIRSIPYMSTVANISCVVAISLI